MMRPATILMLALGLSCAAAPVLAQSSETPRRVHKAAKPRKAAADALSAPAPASRGINTPSTDFSKVERADEEPSGRNGPAFHPTMGSGGMGMGGSF